MNAHQAFKEAEQWHKAFGFAPPELEEVIATAAYHSYMYAKYILKGRFIAGEASIMSVSADAHWREQYIKFLELKYMC